MKEGAHNLPWEEEAYFKTSKKKKNRRKRRWVKKRNLKTLS
jgi:hypothetical protein